MGEKFALKTVTTDEGGSDSRTSPWKKIKRCSFWSFFLLLAVKYVVIEIVLNINWWHLSYQILVMAAQGSLSGQTINDRILAARHSLAGQGLAKAVCKATTEELIGPKKKHLDCK